MKKKWEEIWGRRSRELFLSFGDPLFVMKDGVILECNPQAASLFGVTCQKMKGKMYHQLCPSGEKATELFKPYFQEASKGKSQRFQTTLSKSSGETFFAEVTIHSISLENGSPLFLVHIRDITRQKDMERRLQESEETLREFVENAPLGLFRTTMEGQIIYANPRLLEILGVTREELKEINVRTRIYKNPEDRDRLIALMLEKGKVENYQLQLQKKDGTPLWVSIYARVVRDEKGEVKYLEGAFLDITEEKRLETQLREVHRMEAIGTLVGGIAHEFNNILTGIIGYAELASLKVPSDSPVQKDLGNIKEGAKRAAELVRKLAAFGRKTILKIQKTDLNKLVEDYLPSVKGILPPEIKLEVRLDPLTKPVEIDREAVKEIIISLCKNSIDAMPQGGTLTLETRPFTVEEELAKTHPWLEKGTYSALVVRDTGTGIEDKVLPHIFEPFFTTKGVGKGPGLGLSMVYGLVKQQRGAILVNSKPGKGAEFTVLFPAFTPPKVERDEKKQTAPSVSSRWGRTVLLVEDEGPVKQVIKETLEGGGCRVLEAETGQEALEIIHTKGKFIDLAVLDIILPDISGKEIGNILQEVSPQTRILYISGYSPSSLHPKYRPEEGTAFLQKPFTPRDLLRKVGELMK